MVNKTENRFMKQSKRGIAKLLYGRSLLILLCIIGQIITLMALFYNLSQYSNYIYISYIVLNILSVVVICSCDSDATVKMTWIIVMFLFQPFGWAIYLYDKLDIGRGKLKKNCEIILGESVGFQRRPDGVYRQIKDEDLELYNTCRYLGAAGGNYPYFSQGVEYYSTGQNFLDSFLYDLSRAEDFIFLEYFIIDKGFMWDSVLEVLKTKAKEGVEVRLIYDGLNEFANLPHSYPSELEALGIRCKVFDPVKPILTTAYDARDHRKIAVIDGKIAYTGGINLADEYINKRERFGYWKDVAIRFRGKPVASFTRFFLESWNLHDDRIYYGDYIKVSEEINIPKEEGYVIPYSYCPLSKFKTGEQVYLNIINQAREYVHIMTPYFAIDQTMTDALLYAARRGVEVVIILPHIPDKKYMQHLSKTYYARLTDAGVKFFEYTPGFLHAKAVVSDNRNASVGSVNMDYRSFYHHFENGVYLVNTPVITDIEADFHDTLMRSQAVTITSIKKENILVKISGGIFRLVAPLL